MRWGLDGRHQLSAFVNAHEWVWSTSEIVHFIGLALVVGIAGVFDLRLLGVARQIPVRALNALMPWAVVGLAFNLITGILFLFGRRRAISPIRPSSGRSCFWSLPG